MDPSTKSTIVEFVPLEMFHENVRIDLTHLDRLPLFYYFFSGERISIRVIIEYN